MKKLIVISYIDKSIEIYQYDENVWESPEDFEIDGHFVIDNNCHYMVVDEVKIIVK